MWTRLQTMATYWGIMRNINSGREVLTVIKWLGVAIGFATDLLNIFLCCVQIHLVVRVLAVTRSRCWWALTAILIMAFTVWQLDSRSPCRNINSTMENQRMNAFTKGHMLVIQGLAREWSWLYPTPQHPKRRVRWRREPLSLRTYLDDNESRLEERWTRCWIHDNTTTGTGALCQCKPWDMIGHAGKVAKKDDEGGGFDP